MGQYIQTFTLKPTSGHQYFHCQSSHPLHIKALIPYCQALRVSRIRSSEKDFQTHVSHMKECFLARGYLVVVANNQIDKVVLFLVETSLLKRKIWKVVFLLLLPITLRLKSLEN